MLCFLPIPSVPLQGHNVFQIGIFLLLVLSETPRWGPAFLLLPRHSGYEVAEKHLCQWWWQFTHCQMAVLSQPESPCGQCPVCFTESDRKRQLCAEALRLFEDA